MMLRMFSLRCTWPVIAVSFAGILAGGITASCAFGQDFGRSAGGFSFGMGRGNGTVAEAIQRESARVEVGITSGQQSQIDKLNEERRNQFGTVDFRSLSNDERREYLEKTQADREAKLKSILTAEQYARLQQISWHRAGPGVLLNEPLAKEFKLTEEQRSQFDTIRNDEREIVRDTFRLPTAERAKRLTDVDAKYLAVLTQDQRQQWLEKIGPAPEELAARTDVIQAKNLEDRRALWAQKSAILKEAFEVASEGQKNGRVSALEVMRAEDEYLASTLYAVGRPEERVAIQAKRVEIANSRVELAKTSVDRGQMTPKEVREAKLALIERKMALLEAVESRDAARRPE